MGEFTRVFRDLTCRGIQLSRTVDKLAPGKFARLLNTRSYQDGSLQARPGVTVLNSMAALDQTAMHSCKRLNDPLPGAPNAFIRVVGSGTKLYAGVTPGTSLDTGYSGNPLSLIGYRPPQSPEAWCYVGDSLKMLKVKPDASTTANVGGAPPSSAPTTALFALNDSGASANVLVIDDLAAVGAWATGGDAGPISAAPRLVNTTIAANGILYDSGTTGWASISPTPFTSDLQPGMRLTINSGGGTAETVVVESIQRTSTLSPTTISAIIYDSGTTGLCTVQMAAPNPLLQRNSIVRFAGGIAETVRVLSVTAGPDGLSSFRCSTVNTHAAAESLTGFVSFRAYCRNNHAAGEALSINYLQSTITFATGTGTLTLTSALNLSATGSRPIQEDDVIHISIMLDKNSNLTEARVMLDFDGSTNDFTRNYFFYPIRPNDLTGAVAQTQTSSQARQQAIQREIIDVTDPSLSNEGGSLRQKLSNIRNELNKGDLVIPADMTAPDAGSGQTISDQTSLGTSQWTELTFRIGDLTRVGADSSRGLADVQKLRLNFVVTATTVVRVSSWYIRGTYGPDVEDVARPIQYRYRGRSSTTGAVTNPSPATRHGEIPVRNRVVVTPAQITDTQFDKLDIERHGGRILGWHYVGSTTNVASPTFNDDFLDDAIQGNPPLDLDNYQPFPMTDQPRSGTCNVAGTAVNQVSGDTFNTSWAPGTIININGINYTLYTLPKSTTFLELNENAGSLSAVKWFILEPILLGQPLAKLWGPHPTLNVIFGCGSNYQPGTLFWTKGGNADSAPITHQQEITSPSEPLINGLQLPDGRSLVWSSERYFLVYPSMSTLDEMTVIEAGKRGLFADWALCAGEGKIWWLDKDGIYESEGAGDGVSITDDDLYPLFPHDNIAGVAVNGFNPPDITQTAALRLAYADGTVIFDYLDTSSNRRRLVYRIRDKSWWPDSYAQSMRFAYREEGKGIHQTLFGGNDGKLYVAGGTDDAGTAIAWSFRDAAWDAGDPRPNKEWGDILVDLNSGGANVTVTPGVDNYGTTIAAATLNTTSRPTQNLPKINMDSTEAGVFGRNIELDFSMAASGPIIYGYWPNVDIVPEFVDRWISESTTHGIDGYQIFGSVGFITHISTADITLTITIDGTAYTYTITNSAGSPKKTPFALSAMKGLLTTYQATSASAFRIIKEELEIPVKAWGSNGPFVIMRPFGNDSRSRGLNFAGPGSYQ